MDGDCQPNFDSFDLASRPAHPLCSTPVRDVERLYGEIDRLSSTNRVPWVTSHGTTRALHEEVRRRAEALNLSGGNTN